MTMNLSRSLLRTIPSTSISTSKIASSRATAVIPAVSRHISSKPPNQDVKNPSHASTDPDHKIPYPEDESSGRNIKNDVGHNTTGGKVGRHTQRTLASFSMEGKVCVVTGAARGLGNLIARTFVESGSNSLAIIDLNDSEAKEAAKEVQNWFEEHGQVEKGEIDVRGFGCDISNEDQVINVMKSIKDTFGGIHVVCNSAGIVENFPATEYPSSKIKKLYDININGSFYIAREAAKHMMESKIQGSIILVASMSAGVVNVPQPQAPYNASKAAVRHMAASLAVEWAKDNIRVNSLSPGYMLTSLTRTILEQSPTGKELRNTWENLTPMGRMGDPEDLKGAAIYLASDASKFTTGTDLLVDGGYSSV